MKGIIGCASYYNVYITIWSKTIVYFVDNIALEVHLDYLKFVYSIEWTHTSHEH